MSTGSFVRVCQDWFPKGSYKGQKADGFLMDELVKMQIDVLLKNITKDWDFTIIITGQGEVRVGKSFMAAQIACYWAYQIEKLYGIKVPFSLENFVLDGKKLIETGNKFGKESKYVPLVYDEAGADLEGRKVMSSMTQDVLDYYRECGQYNFLNILVLPEYFDLPKSIAMSRSIFLIDIYYSTDTDGNFNRGYLNFFSRRNKKYLYMKGKKELDYHAHPYDFHGKFKNFFPLDLKEYQKLKYQAMLKRESRRRNKFQIQRDACWYLLCSEGLPCKCGENVKISQRQLAKRMEQITGIFVSHVTLSDALRHMKVEEEY